MKSARKEDGSLAQRLQQPTSRPSVDEPEGYFDPRHTLLGKESAHVFHFEQKLRPRPAEQIRCIAHRQRLPFREETNQSFSRGSRRRQDRVGHAQALLYCPLSVPRLRIS